MKVVIRAEEWLGNPEGSVLVVNNATGKYLVERGVAEEVLPSAIKAEESQGDNQDSVKIQHRQFDKMVRRSKNKSAETQL
jgi:hypothetical protein